MVQSKLDICGGGAVYLVFSPPNDGKAKAYGQTNTEIELGHNVRLYFARDCNRGPASYAAWPLLGKRIAFTTDLGGAGCGCNVAV